MPDIFDIAQTVQQGQQMMTHGALLQPPGMAPGQSQAQPTQPPQPLQQPLQQPPQPRDIFDVAQAVQGRSLLQFGQPDPDVTAMSQTPSSVSAPHPELQQQVWENAAMGDATPSQRFDAYHAVMGMQGYPNAPLPQDVQEAQATVAGMLPQAQSAINAAAGYEGAQRQATENAQSAAWRQAYQQQWDAQHQQAEAREQGKLLSPTPNRTGNPDQDIANLQAWWKENQQAEREPREIPKWVADYMASLQNQRTVTQLPGSGDASGPQPSFGQQMANVPGQAVARLAQTGAGLLDTAATVGGAAVNALATGDIHHLLQPEINEQSPGVQAIRNITTPVRKFSDAQAAANPTPGLIPGTLAAAPGLAAMYAAGPAMPLVAAGEGLGQQTSRSLSEQEANGAGAERYARAATEAAPVSAEHFITAALYPRFAGTVAESQLPSFAKTFAAAVVQGNLDAATADAAAKLGHGGDMHLTDNLKASVGQGMIAMLMHAVPYYGSELRSVDSAAKALALPPEAKPTLAKIRPVMQAAYDGKITPADAEQQLSRTLGPEDMQWVARANLAAHPDAEAGLKFYNYDNPRPALPGSNTGQETPNAPTPPTVDTRDQANRPGPPPGGGEAAVPPTEAGAPVPDRSGAAAAVPEGRQPERAAGPGRVDGQPDVRGPGERPADTAGGGNGNPAVPGLRGPAGRAVAGDRAGGEGSGADVRGVEGKELAAPQKEYDAYPAEAPQPQLPEPHAHQTPVVAPVQPVGGPPAAAEAGLHSAGHPAAPGAAQRPAPGPGEQGGPLAGQPAGGEPAAVADRAGREGQGPAGEPAGSEGVSEFVQKKLQQKAAGQWWGKYPESPEAAKLTDDALNSRLQAIQNGRGTINDWADEDKQAYAGLYREQWRRHLVKEEEARFNPEIERSVQRGTWDNGERFPQVGTSVETTVPNIMGSPSYVDGIVKQRPDGSYYVKVTSTDVAGAKTSKLTPRWKVKEAAEANAGGTEPATSAGAPGGLKQRYTTVPDAWLGKRVESTRGGSAVKLLGVNPNGTKKLIGAAEQRQHGLTRIPKNSPLLDAIRAKTDEVWPIQGRPQVLVPQRAVEEAKAATVPAPGAAPTAAPGATPQSKITRMQQIVDQIRSIHPEAKRYGSLAASRTGIKSGDALAWAQSQPKDSEAFALAHLHEQAKKDPPGTTYQMVTPSELVDGARIKLGKETLTYDRENQTLENGITTTVTPSMQIPAKEVLGPREDFDADKAGASQQKPGLYGQPTFDKATGAETAPMFHEPVTVQRPAEKPVGSKEANRPENTAPLFHPVPRAVRDLVDLHHEGGIDERKLTERDYATEARNIATGGREAWQPSADIVRVAKNWVSSTSRPRKESASLASSSSGGGTPPAPKQHAETATATIRPKSPGRNDGFAEQMFGSKSFIGGEVAPKLGKVVEDLRSVKTDLQDMLLPQSASKKADQAKQLLRIHGGRLARRQDQVEHALAKARAYFEFQPEKAALDFYDRFEKGERQPNLSLQAFDKQIRDVLNKLRDEVRSLGTGRLSQFLENYFPHIWKDPEKAQGLLAQYLGKRPLEGSKSFLKKRTVPTIAEGIAAGLKPVSDNPIDLVSLKAAEMSKYILGQHVGEWMKQAELIKYVSSLDKPPEGYAKINDPAFVVYGPPTVAVKEAFDRLQRDKLLDFAGKLGIQHERLTALGRGRWGTSIEGANQIKTRFGGPNSVIAHEIGHQLDDRYGLYEWLSKVPLVEQEFHDLAASRHEGETPKPHFKKYVQEPEERAAAVVEAYVHAPEKFKEVAPRLYSSFENFIDQHPELHDLKSIKPSLVIGTETNQQPHGGLLKLGDYYAPREVAQVVNNYLSPGLRQKGWFRMLAGPANTQNRVNLSLSAFHASTTSVNSIVTQAATGLQHLVDGRPLKAMKSLAISTVAPFHGLYVGNQMMKEWREPGSVKNPHIGDMVKWYQDAGGRIGMDRALISDIAKSQAKSLANAVKMLDEGKYLGASLNALAVAGKTPLVAADKFTKLILQSFVPRVKAAAFAQKAAMVLDNLPTDASQEQILKELDKTSDALDDVFGQMVYANLMWDNRFKDLSQLVFRAPGWNLGNARLLLAGAGEAVNAAADAAKAAVGKGTERPRLSDRTAYLIALTLLAGAAGGMLNWAMTGEPPKDWRDFVFPRTGKKDAAGHDIRMSLPTYLKDYAGYATHPVRTLINKLNPFFGFAIRLLQNKDYFGTQIYNTDDPSSTQLKDISKYVGKEFLPFSVQSYQKQAKDKVPIGEQVASFVGVNRAPQEYSLSAAEKLARQYAADKYPAGARSKAEFERSMKKKELLQEEESHDPDAAADIAKAVQDGEIRYSDAKSLQKGQHLPELEHHFKQLDGEKAAAVWKVATPEERERLKSMAWRQITFDPSIKAEKRLEIKKELSVGGLNPMQMYAELKHVGAERLVDGWGALTQTEQETLRPLIQRKIARMHPKTTPYTEKQELRSKLTATTQPVAAAASH